METLGDTVSKPSLPERIFVAGEEPAGERVSAYHKSGQIKTILDTLEPEEVDIIKKSSWGKFIATAEKPSFSGRFARYVLTRQLNVNKNYEIWVVFAGRPIRFSLREFAVVTGLPCGEVRTQKKKRKLRLKEEPYWGKLFGTNRSIYVNEVIALLQRKTVGDSVMRVKYACLALLSSVMCPTSSSKIVPWQAEIISDLDEFFAYPWGRVSFEMLIKSIKERDVVGLSQQTIAVKGFVHAFQLVMVEAVPTLLEVPQAAYYSYSESEEEEEGVSKKKDVPNKVRRKDNDKPSACMTVAIIPGHARHIDDACEVVVDTIIADPEDVHIDESKLCWTDELEDPKVDNLLRLYKEDCDFTKDMFVGGYTKEVVARLEKEKKEQQDREKELKAKKGKQKDVLLSEGESSGMSDNHLDQLAGMVFDKIKVCFASIDKKVDSMMDKISDVKASVAVEEKVNKFPSLETMLSDIVKVLDRSGRNGRTPTKTPQPEGGGIFDDDILHDHGRRGNKGQEEAAESQDEADDRQEQDGGTEEEGNGSEEEAYESQASDNTLVENTYTEENADERSSGKLKKKRSTRRKRVTPQRLKDDYEREKRNKMRDAEILRNVLGDGVAPDNTDKCSLLLEELKNHPSIDLEDGNAVTNKEITDLVERTKVLTGKMIDVLVRHIQLAFTKLDHKNSGDRVLLFDTKLVGNLVRSNQKFMRSKDPTDFKAPEVVRAYFTTQEDGSLDASRIYFPLSFQRQHWVGVCVDLKVNEILVLDCNMSFSSVDNVKKTVNPIGLMFPHLLQAVLGKEKWKQLAPFPVKRIKGIPQNPIHSDSGVTSLLLMRAHAVGGITACGVVKPEIVGREAIKLAVSVYEKHVGVLAIEDGNGKK